MERALLEGEKAVDLSKPIQTRDGCKAVFLEETGGYGYFSVKPAAGGSWCIKILWGSSHNYRSILHKRSPDDIINVPEREELFVNVYTGGSVRPYIGSFHKTLDGARSQLGSYAGAILGLTFEDGKVVAARIAK